MAEKDLKRVFSNLLALIFIGVNLIGCGATKQNIGSTEAGSQLSANTDGPAADCSGAQDNELEFQLSSYYRSGETQPVSNVLRMHFSFVPRKIIESSHHHIQLLLWYANKPEEQVFDQTPVQFYFQRRGSGELINRNDPQNTLSKAVLQNMVTESNKIQDGTNLSNFFEKHILILKNIDLIYDAVSVTIYDNSEGNNTQNHHLNALLPRFYANPWDYISTHSAPRLQALHPNYKYRNSKYTDQQYLDMTDEYCKMFF